jgi:two-component system, LuxR family, response regulator FixJ
MVQAKFRGLSAKETEVLELLKQGLPNKEIASRLDLTLRAVELRRSNLMRKLGVRSLAELLHLTFGQVAAPEDQ